MAVGCPVIATDLGAPPEILRTASNAANPGERLQPSGKSAAHYGWLVEPGNAAALADRLGEALTTAAGERDTSGRAARAHIATHFSSEAMKRAKLAVYDELLGTRLAAAFDVKSLTSILP